MLWRCATLGIREVMLHDCVDTEQNTQCPESCHELVHERSFKLTDMGRSTDFGRICEKKMSGGFIVLLRIE